MTQASIPREDRDEPDREKHETQRADDQQLDGDLSLRQRDDHEDATRKTLHDEEGPETSAKCVCTAHSSMIRGSTTASYSGAPRLRLRCHFARNSDQAASNSSREIAS